MTIMRRTIQVGGSRGMTAKDTVSTEEAEFDPQKYRPRCSSDAEKLRLLGATREEIRRWFGVHEFFLDKWASEQKDFARALQTKPTSLSVGYHDYGLVKWLYDFRRGALDV